MDVNKDESCDFLFFSAFLDLQSIRDDEATSLKELILFNALTDGPSTSGKTQVDIANSGKTMTFYESIRAFPKTFELPIILKDSWVPGTWNNRGLTECIKLIKVCVSYFD